MIHRKILIYSFFIILILACSVSFAQSVSTTPGVPIGKELIDYIEGLTGVDPKAGYMCLIRSGGENVGAVYIINFRDRWGCCLASRAFEARDTSRGAISFEKWKGRRLITVMEGINSVSCMTLKDEWLTYAKSKDINIAIQGLLSARVKSGAAKIIAGTMGLLAAVTAVVFVLIRFLPRLAIPGRIRVRPTGAGPKMKLGPKVSVEPKIKMHGAGPKIKMPKEGPKIKIKEVKEKRGPKIRFDT